MAWLAREKDVEQLAQRLTVLEWQFGALLRLLGFDRDGNTIRVTGREAVSTRRVQALEESVGMTVARLTGRIETLEEQLAPPKPVRRRTKKS